MAVPIPSTWLCPLTAGADAGSCVAEDARTTNVSTKLHSHVVNCLSNICSWLLALPLPQRSLPAGVVQLRSLPRRGQLLSLASAPPQEVRLLADGEQLLGTEPGVEAEDRKTSFVSPVIATLDVGYSPRR